MKKHKILAIIPARGGSKRVLRKNFRPFAGTTLVDLAIEQGLRSKYIDHIALSSDVEEVLSIGRKYERVSNICRPDGLSNDESSAIEYVRHTLAFMETKNEISYDIVVILQPSSPLRRASDIDATIELLSNHKEVDSAVSIVRVAHMVHPLKLKVLKGQELFPFIDDEKGRFASNELPDIYVRNCAVYATWRGELENRPDVIGKKSLGYVMGPETSVDINEMVDFEFAEFLFKKHSKEFLLKGN